MLSAARTEHRLLALSPLYDPRTVAACILFPTIPVQMQGRVEAGESVALLAEILDPSSALK